MISVMVSDVHDMIKNMLQRTLSVTSITLECYVHYFECDVLYVKCYVHYCMLWPLLFHFQVFS